MEKNKVIKTTTDINTNMTAVELKSSLVKDLPPMSEEEKEFAIKGIVNYIEQMKFCEHLILMRKEDGYITIFQNEKSWMTYHMARNVFGFLETEEPFKSLGLNLVEPCGDHIEVWAGGKFYALFDGTDFVIKL